MNRTLTVEIRDIPDEVWEFLVSEKGSEDAVDGLIREILTTKATTALILVYQVEQARKAGISLESMVPEITEKLMDGLEGESWGDDLKFEIEKKAFETLKKVEAKKDAAD